MFQESARIAQSVKTLALALDTLGDIEIVLVDDGSTDGTANIAKREIDEHPDLRVELVVLERNRGKGGAIAEGVARTTGHFVAFTDADLSTSPEAIARCFDAIESGDADVVVTTRHAESSKITESAPTARRVSTSIFRRLLNWRVGLDRYSDTQCGLKAFTRDAALTLFSDLSVQRFAFDVEVLLRAELAGFRVIELPVEWRHVDDSTVRPVRDGARMAIDVLRLRGRVHRWQSPSDRLPVLAVLERRHWWYVSHRDLVTDVITSAFPAGSRHCAVDAGASTGPLVDRLAEIGFEKRFGFDPVESVIPFARGQANPRAPVGTATIDALPVRTGVADLVTSLDTIASAPDDLAVIRELSRIVRPGGLVVVTGPGLRSMWSDYDRALGHLRRYDREDLSSLFERAGLETVRTTHFQTWLTPVNLLLNRTRVGKAFLQRPERSTFVDARLNLVLRVFVALERLLLRTIDLPRGQAVLGVARRPIT